MYSNDKIIINNLFKQKFCLHSLRIQLDASVERHAYHEEAERDGDLGGHAQKGVEPKDDGEPNCSPRLIVGERWLLAIPEVYGNHGWTKVNKISNNQFNCFCIRICRNFGSLILQTHLTVFFYRPES